MWNTISCSRITQQRTRQKSYDKHVQKVNTMRSKIKISEPQQPWFVYANKKRQMSHNEQLMNIEKSNHLLLAKLKNIETRQNQKYKKPTFLTTLNSKIMQQANAYIFKENKRICDKIMTSQPFYKTGKILQNSNGFERVMQNISLNARRVQSAKCLAASKSRISRPLTSSLRRPMSSHLNDQNKQKLDLILKRIQNTRMRPSTAPSVERVKPHSQRPNENQDQLEGDKFT